MKKNFNLIGKYLRGDASLEERIQVMKWAEGNDTQRDEFNALRRIYDATLLMDDDIAMSKRRTGLRRYWKWLAAAAVVAFVAGISYLPENFRDDPTPHLQFRSLSAPIGQQTKTVLSDGTVVWLNSGIGNLRAGRGRTPGETLWRGLSGCRARHRPSLYRGDIAHGGPGFGYPIQRQCLR